MMELFSHGEALSGTKLGTKVEVSAEWKNLSDSTSSILPAETSIVSPSARLDKFTLGVGEVRTRTKASLDTQLKKIYHIQRRLSSLRTKKSQKLLVVTITQ